MKAKRVIGIGLLAALLSVSIASPAAAATASCTPTDVAVLDSRVHVKCTDSKMDGSSRIWYWAVSTSEADRASRFLTATTTALVAGRRLTLFYTAGDTSGTSFGCLAHDCRKVSGVAVY